MDGMKVLEEFLKCLQQFDDIVIKGSVGNSTRRKNVYVGTAGKRWMQIDIRDTNLNVSMDHRHGDLTMEDVLRTGIPKKRIKGKTAFNFKVDPTNFDAVHFTFYETDPYNFENELFMDFISKHLSSHRKLLLLKTNSVGGVYK